MQCCTAKARSSEFMGFVSPPVTSGCWNRWSVRFLLVLNLCKSSWLLKKRTDVLRNGDLLTVSKGKDYSLVMFVSLRSNILDSLVLNLIRIFCWNKLKDFVNVLIYANDFLISFGAQYQMIEVLMNIFIMHYWVW